MSRIRANTIVNGAGTGAPNFPRGAIISGISTINAEISVGTGTSISSPGTNEFVLGTNNVERLRITSDGKVGIGEDSPGSLLHIGKGTNTDDGSVAFTIGGTSVNSRQSTITKNNVGSGDRALEIRASTGGTDETIKFFSDSTTERLRIGSAGQLGIGGANYGTSGQVLKSTGTNTAPSWQNTQSFMFFGEQDTEQTIATNTYSRIQNLGTNDFSIGDSSIASFDESIGRVTIGADGAGYYYLQVNAGIDDVQSGDYAQVVIGKNGNTNGDFGTRISTYGRGWNSTNANQVTTTSTSCIALLAASDYVQFYVYHNEGTDEKTEPNRCSVMGWKLN